ncbi:uncharacterized protein LOC120000010 [Tripterygium wilfordii]|uniref:uncharacterized protein LOC120000010 n=1 Tax=Tripterygium wilfordii TaxID=458696 RepID=UPI0018F81D9D|nr:uncharacterized protein LOC120000010 [Tripterygium wilfordii]
MMTLSILQYAAPPVPLSDNLRIQAQPPSKEEVSAKINSLIVVATVVTGATFTASVDVPDGDSEKETKKWRYAFVICDTIAMNMALIAAMTLCWAQQVDINTASLAAWAASCLVGGSLFMLCFAFLAAVLTEFNKYPTFQSIVVIIEALSIPFLSVVLVPLVMPSRIKHMLLRLFYMAVFLVCYIVENFGKGFALLRQKK